jgi:hypothetical protein
VSLAVSLESPAGPWRELGTWKLERATDGSVVPFTFEQPTWARFVRFSSVAPKRSRSDFELPDAVRIIERPEGADYRTVLGEWGSGNRSGPFEWLNPPDVAAPPGGTDSNDTPETADTLEPGAPASGRVSRGADVDWYVLTIPADHNTVSITVAGKPILATALTLVDVDGLRVPMLFGPAASPGTVEYRAEVIPGATYRLEVAQPASSISFLFDTSISIAGWLPYIAQSLRSFSADVMVGEEFVQIMPFEEDPLLEHWSDDRYELQNAVDQYLGLGSSSSVEAAMVDAAKALSAREGARAILVETDAETTSYDHSTELWQVLGSVRPLVFAVHVGAQSTPLLSRSQMEDYATVADGVYQYATTYGDMMRAFDRLATWLRRPAGYELTMATSFQEEPPPSRKPGTISVVPPPDNPSVGGIGSDVGVEIILDTSGSMLRRSRGERRIDGAKRVLNELVTEGLPPGTPVALRVLGDRDDPCGTNLAVPLQPLDPARVTELVNGIEVVQEADTPLGGAIASVPDDLANSTGTRILLVITDSQEVWPHPDLCGMDPAAAIRSLRRHGIDARLNIVGFGLTNKKAKTQLRTWARLGNGSYFDARGSDDLARAIRAAVGAPFRVEDQAGNEIASGTVGGSPVPVPPGTWDVVVLSDPVQRFEDVVVEPKGSVALTLPMPQDIAPEEP